MSEEYLRINRVKVCLVLIAAFCVLLCSGGSLRAEATAEAIPTPAPVYSYSFSFAGDCTIGALLEWQNGKGRVFPAVVGEDYAYPMSKVADIFAADDMTIVNLEGVFTDATVAKRKPYRLKGDPKYVQVLTEGSVEAVSMANNHSGDFFEQGLEDTRRTLDGAGILHSETSAPLIVEMDGGMKLGLVAYSTVEKARAVDVWSAEIKADIDACKEAQCDLIIAFLHWGSERKQVPAKWEAQLAHDMADWGCSMIVGAHPHILQRMEFYNGVPIFYSLGNFCFGGATAMLDRDSVIVQADFSYNSADRGVEIENVRVIPCCTSSTTSNDYCPAPYEPGSKDYERVLRRLEWNQASEY